MCVVAMRYDDSPPASWQQWWELSREEGEEREYSVPVLYSGPVTSEGECCWPSLDG